MVALNAEGRVIRPAILWNDQRTGKAMQLKPPFRQELIAHWKSYDYRVSIAEVSCELKNRKRMLRCSISSAKRLSRIRAD